MLADSARTARERIEQPFPGATEACGYQLNRVYNILERGFERICESFENHFEKRGDFHEQLLRRMTLSLPGIRPAFLPDEAIEPLRELKGFRHIFRHAYDLNLIKERMEPLVNHAETLALEHPKRIEAFIKQVRTQLE